MLASIVFTPPIPSSTTTPSSRPISSAGGTELDDIFVTHDALGVGQLVKTGKLGARELLDSTLGRLRTLNGSLNAITDFYERDLLEKSAAAAGAGPFPGRPFRVKQPLPDFPGPPTTPAPRPFSKDP